MPHSLEALQSFPKFPFQNLSFHSALVRFKVWPSHQRPRVKPGAMPPLPFESTHILFLPAGIEHQIALTPLPHRSLISTLRLQSMCGLQSSVKPLKALAMVRLLAVHHLPVGREFRLYLPVELEMCQHLLAQKHSSCRTVLDVLCKNPCY